MKTTKHLILIFSFLMGYNSILAQLPIWSLPNQTVNMTSLPNLTSTPLPTPTTGPYGGIISWPDGYDGRSAETAHNIMHDANGDLLFFIVDGYIFDKNGWLMSSVMAGLGDGNFSIVPVADNCNKYYILASELSTNTACGSNYVHDLFYNTLDLTTGHVEISPAGGMLNNNISLRALLPTSLSTNEWDDNMPKRRSTSYSITPIDTNDERFIFVQTESAIIRYKLTQTGISYDNYYWKGTQSLISSLESCTDYRITRQSESTEMEVILLSNGNYRLAFEMELINAPNYGGINTTPTIAIVDIDGTTKQILPSTLNLIPYDFYSNPYFTKGLEFSPSGNYLYIVHPPSTLHPNCIESYDVLNQNFVTSFNLTNNFDYRNSQIEIGYDNNLYITSPTGLARISNPEAPATSTLTVVQQLNINETYALPVNCINPTVAYQDTTYVLPKQIDGEDPFARFAENCCNIVDGATYNYTAPTGNSTWSPGNNPFGNATNQVLVDGYIKIPTGATVRINNMTFSFAQLAQLIIEKNAKVYLNNSILTSDACNGIMWEGVRVYGTSNANQGFNNQGYLSMINNSEINNAYVGVSLHKRDNSGSIDWSTNGGRVFAKDSKFKNNKRDVIFLSYNIANSLSSFTNCEFLTTIYPLADGTSTPNVHVSMLAVKGIKFSGCKFDNTTTSNIVDRGKGIVSIDAGYEVTFLCNVMAPLGTPCPTNSRTLSSFSNLEYGIESRNSSNTANTVTVKYTDFVENNRAAHLLNINDYTFVNNTVNLGAPFSPNYDWPYGLYSDGCTRYTVENNTFNTAYSGASYGIIMSNSNDGGTTDDKNEVYHNKFNNLLCAVNNQNQNVQILNNNPVGSTGVTYRCNEFNNSALTDLFVGSNSNGAGISIHQGSCDNTTSPSNNLYSATNPVFSNIWNNNPANYQLTTVIGSNGPSRLTPTLSNTMTTHNSHCSSINYDSILSCPVKRFDVTKLNPIILGGRIAILEDQAKETKALFHKATLEVNELWKKASAGVISWRHFTTSIVNDYSPYISLEILSEIVAKAEIIPQGYVKEIIMVNYPLTQKTIEEIKKSALSDAIKNQILRSNFIGSNNRLELESSVYYYEREIAFLNRDIIKYHLTDSTVNGLDSVIVLFETKTDLNSKKQLVDFYRANNQDLKAKQLLEEIQNLEGKSDFVLFQNSLLNNDNNYTLTQNSNDYDNLTSLRDLAFKTSIGSRSNSLISYLRGEEIEEIEPIMLKSASFTTEEFSEIINEDDNYLVYPNPTTGIITIELLLDNNENASIDIMDGVGKIVKQTKITNTKSYIDLSELSNGIYFLKIKNQNNQTIIKKIIKR